MARKTLEARIKLKVDGLDKLNKVVSQINKATNQMNQLGNKGNTVSQSLNNASKNANSLNTNLKKSNTAMSGLARKAKQFASAYLGVMGTRAVLNTSDIITSAENKLNYLNGGNTNATQESLDKMYASAQKVRSGYTDMVNNVSKSMTLAGDAFQGNIDNAIRFQEIMSEAYSVGGASAAEQASSMYQLIQALGSGILQGDELRSVREGAPIAYKEIEKFAQGVYNTEESLKDLASQGKITSDIVVAAMMQAGEGIDEAFAKTDMTFAQAFKNIQNTATKAFEPVLQKMNDALNKFADTGGLTAIGNALEAIANGVLWLMDVLGVFFNWFAENWYWIQWIVLSVLIVLIGYLVILAAKAIWTGLCMFWSFLMGLSPLTMIILTLGVATAAMVYFANTCVTGIEFIVKALQVLALAIAVIALITGSTFLLIIAGIVLLAALIIQFLDYVMGAVYVAGAFIVNLAIGLVNSVIQIIWSMGYPIISIIEWILNCINGGFNTFGDLCANLIGQIIGWFLTLGKVVTTIIDAIFGTNWTAGLESLRQSVTAWGKNEQAITITGEAPQIDRIEYGAAWDKGFAQGTSWKDSIGTFGSNLKDDFKSLGKFNAFGDLGKIDESALTGVALDQAMGSIIDDPASRAAEKASGSGYDPSKALKGISDTADNTGRIADSMDLTEEDLQYLRDVANMEWKREYTTANITLDVTNNNNVNSDLDVFGIAHKLTEVLYEEADYLPNGVY